MDDILPFFPERRNLFLPNVQRKERIFKALNYS